MRRWLVVTPSYGAVTEIICDGQGPFEEGCDVIEIEAENVKDAISFGVQIMLRGRHRDYWCHGHSSGWCEDARSDGVSPYAGVKAIPVQES